MFVFEALAYAASEIKLEGGSTLIASNIAYSRSLPHAFYDQALASLPHLFPQHVLLASRRSGALGEVEYALVSFKETRSSNQVVIQAIAVHKDQAWNLEVTAPASAYGDTLVQVLEIIGALPGNPGVQGR